jgi:hypothetical protein
MRDTPTRHANGDPLGLDTCRASLHTMLHITDPERSRAYAFS